MKEKSVFERIFGYFFIKNDSKKPVLKLHKTQINRAFHAK